MGRERDKPVQLLRPDGGHRVWISRKDVEKLDAGGHILRVSEDVVRLLSDTEKRDRRVTMDRALEAAGVRVYKKGRGLGKIG